MAAILLKTLEISHEAAHTTTLGFGGQIMQNAKDSQKTSTTIQYMDHLAPVTEPEVLAYRCEPTIQCQDYWSSGPGTGKLIETSPD
jgi:hypothetical protein